VDASKIRDGSIGKEDISTAFIKKVTIPDQNTGTDRAWDPNGSRRDVFITDTSVKEGSAISITLYPNSALNVCIGMPRTSTEGQIYIWCNNRPFEGVTLTYVLIN
jgi:hypothetical protein